MVQFCTAYAGILSRHNLCATSTTGRMVAEATGLDVHLFLSCQHGGSQQDGARPGEGIPLYLPALRPEQHPLRLQCGHRGDAGVGHGPGRPGLEEDCQSQAQSESLNAGLFPADSMTLPVMLSSRLDRGREHCSYEQEVLISRHTYAGTHSFLLKKKRIKRKLYSQGIRLAPCFILECCGLMQQTRF